MRRRRLGVLELLPLGNCRLATSEFLGPLSSRETLIRMLASTPMLDSH